MDDDEIYGLLESVYDFNTAEELQDEAAMLAQLRELFGLPDPVLKEIILGAQVMKALRGHRLPVWAQYEQKQ